MMYICWIRLRSNQRSWHLGWEYVRTSTPIISKDDLCFAHLYGVFQLLSLQNNSKRKSFGRQSLAHTDKKKHTHRHRHLFNWTSQKREKKKRNNNNTRKKRPNQHSKDVLFRTFTTTKRTNAHIKVNDLYIFMI